MSRINYDLTKLKGFVFDIDGVLSPNTVPLAPDGTPARMVNIKDGYALKLAIKRGYKMAIISGASGDTLLRRFHNLGFTDIYLITGAKLPFFKDWLTKTGLQPEEVAFVGDDIPDADCIRLAGLGVAPADAADDIAELADYISPANGGYGVARDLLEQVMRVQGTWPSTAEAFG